jgi:hypothetical protein
MPARDGTGPYSEGPLTGRGLGSCEGSRPGLVRRGIFGRGRGFRCGFGRGFAIGRKPAKTQKEALEEQRARLQDSLNLIDQQLENL